MMECDNYSIDDVCDYFLLSCEDSINLTKMNILLYFTQAWSVVLRNRRFFDEEFQAWIFGPVNPRIHKRFGSLNSGIWLPLSSKNAKTTDIENLPFKKDAIYFLNNVMDIYGHVGSASLSNMVRSDNPWLNARGETPSNERCDAVISEEDMLNYYQAGLSQND